MPFLGCRLLAVVRRHDTLRFTYFAYDAFDSLMPSYAVLPGTINAKVISIGITHVVEDLISPQKSALHLVHGGLGESVRKLRFTESHTAWEGEMVLEQLVESLPRGLSKTDLTLYTHAPGGWDAWQRQISPNFDRPRSDLTCWNIASMVNFSEKRYSKRGHVPQLNVCLEGPNPKQQDHAIWDEGEFRREVICVHLPCRLTHRDHACRSGALHGDPIGTYVR